MPRPPEFLNVSDIYDPLLGSFLGCDLPEGIPLKQNLEFKKKMLKTKTKTKTYFCGSDIILSIFLHYI